MDCEDKRQGTSGQQQTEESITEPGMSRRRMLSVSFEKIITAGGIVFAAVPLLLPTDSVAECTCEPCSSPNVCRDDMCDDPSDYCTDDHCEWDICGYNACQIDGCTEDNCRKADLCETEDPCLVSDTCVGDSEIGDTCNDDFCYTSDSCDNHTCLTLDACHQHVCEDDTCVLTDCASGHLQGS